MSMTVDKGIDVRGFKKALSTKLGGRGPFKLLGCDQEVLTDEQGLRETLLCHANNKKHQKWPKPYAGE